MAANTNPKHGRVDSGRTDSSKAASGRTASGVKVSGNMPSVAKATGRRPSGKKQRSKAPIVVVVLVVLVAIGIGLGLWVNSLQNTPETPDPEPQQQTVIQDTDAGDTEPTRVDNPVDFASLQAQNPEIYAWITIPDTQINYPICQSNGDQNFYLNHGSDGAYYDPGAIYTEWSNTLTFNDAVTLIYGHSGYGDIMFGTLHYFENADFFNAHEYFTIYTPGHILTYRVVSAYMYDDRHIMNTFDFAQESVVADYFASVTNPTSLVRNVREGIELVPGDKIVQLSTCMEDLSLGTNRYLVTGVLVEDQLTY